MGTYWGQISDPCVSEVVESADAQVCPPLPPSLVERQTVCCSHCTLLPLSPAHPGWPPLTPRFVASALPPRKLAIPSQLVHAQSH